MNLKGKKFMTSLKGQIEKMTYDQRRELRANTKLIMKQNGYYVNVSKLRKYNPLQ